MLNSDRNWGVAFEEVHMASQVHIWYCSICGEIIYSLSQPSRCPACGAHPYLLSVPLTEPHILGRGVEVSPALAAGGYQALVQETDTSELYSRIMVAARHPLLREAFRSLARIEGRHAALLAAAFKVKRPQPTLMPDLSTATHRQMLDMVRAREDDTIVLYQRLMDLGAGGEFSSIFQALIEIETDHNEFVTGLADIAGD